MGEQPLTQVTQSRARMDLSQLSATVFKQLLCVVRLRLQVVQVAVE